MFEISLRDNVKAIQRQLSNVAYQQVPYATAVALNALAKRAQAEGVKAVDDTFDRPTPFTKKAFAIRYARKGSPTAVIFAKDIQSEYLEPYEDGGKQFLGTKRAMLTPRGAQLNQYGNLPRSALKNLKGRKGVFVGKIKTKSGETISGVWQRPTAVAPGRKAAKTANVSGHLRLLIRFTDPIDVRQRLHFVDRTTRIVDRWFDYEFGQALARAIASSK